MKIWITRQSAGSIMSGGLERLDVWFEKPTYIEYKYFSPEDSPFTLESPDGIFSGDCWEIVQSGKRERKSFSFGSVFGYINQEDSSLNEMATKVWEKLVEHFGGIKFGYEWQDRERAGLSKKKDFILELDLNVSLVGIKNFYTNESEK